MVVLKSGRMSAILVLYYYNALQMKQTNEHRKYLREHE